MASPRSAMQPLLRHAAPNLSRYFFASCQCPRRAASTNASSSGKLLGAASNAHQYRSPRQTPFLKAFRTQSTVAVPSPVKSLIGSVRAKLPEATRPELEGRFPKTSRRAVGWWLLGSAASVFGLVVFGGLTRLTESGLSITEWRPVTGSLPPLSGIEWDIEFMKYRMSPEFQKLNPNMTLPEFKRIYWMEWIHRAWGRVVGLTMLLPTIYFIARRRVSAPVARNLLLINGLIITQGAVGWWMVKSGLKDDLFASGAVPRVSQYRLATHLMLAFGTYTAMVWNGLQIFREQTLVNKEQPNRSLKLIQRMRSPQLRVFRIATMLTAGLAVVTAFSGALVAGLDAGLIYNEFPFMGNGLTPPKSELFSPFYSRQPADGPQSDLVWRNMFENPSLVQLDHRILAVTTFTAVNALFIYGRMSPVVRNNLTAGARRMLAGCFGLVWLQASLGLTTLLYLVPTPLAAAHQAGALALLTGFTVLSARVFTPPRLARLIKTRAESVLQRKIARGERSIDGKIGGPTKGAVEKLNME